jgi:hypothetical protein
VFVDPDDLSQASVAISGHPELITVHLTTTAFTSMTLEEVIDFMNEVRRERPEVEEFYENHLNDVRTDFFARMQRRRKERRISGSFLSLEDARKLAKQAFSGARVVNSEPVGGVCELESLTDFGMDIVAYDQAHDHEPVEVVATALMHMKMLHWLPHRPRWRPSRPHPKRLKITLPRGMLAPQI